MLIYDDIHEVHDEHVQEAAPPPKDQELTFGSKTAAYNFVVEKNLRFITQQLRKDSVTRLEMSYEGAGDSGSMAEVECVLFAPGSSKEEPSYMRPVETWYVMERLHGDQMIHRVLRSEWRLCDALVILSEQIVEAEGLSGWMNGAGSEGYIVIEDDGAGGRYTHRNNRRSESDRVGYARPTA